MRTLIYMLFKKLIVKKKVLQPGLKDIIISMFYAREFAELSQQNLSFVFSFLDLFISMQVTKGKHLVIFNCSLHRSKFDVCFALVGTSANDLSAFNLCQTRQLLKISPAF